MVVLPDDFDTSEATIARQPPGNLDTPMMAAEPGPNGEVGSTDFTCGACGHLLATGMFSAQQITGFVLECPACLKLNATRF